MIDLKGKIRIVQLDQYNMTFEVFKEGYNSIKKEKTPAKWIKVGGYYGNLKQCTRAIKDYLIAEENKNNDNLDILEYLRQIEKLYIEVIENEQTGY